MNDDLKKHLIEGYELEIEKAEAYIYLEIAFKSKEEVEE